MAAQVGEEIERSDVIPLLVDAGGQGVNFLGHHLASIEIFRRNNIVPDSLHS